MRKSPARKRFVVMLLLAAWLTCVPALGQKPADRDRGLKDTTTSTATTVSLGAYIALVIGNNNYRYLGKLETPRNDAADVAKLLQKRYGFTRQKLLLDATRDDIFAALSEYQHTLPENSNLLIYYAGHGYHDPGTDEAYWLPVDAQPGNRDHWISANDITTNIRVIPSKHVLIISDSCYSGVLTRSVDDEIRLERDQYLGKILKSKSRNLLSSGGDEPVLDSGLGGHSVFANAILRYLSEMEDEQFSAADLFPKIKRGVAGRSPQVPQYSFIRNSGDEFGDFVFSRDGKAIAIGPGGLTGGGEPTDYSVKSLLPEIACKRELGAQGVGPKIQAGDMVPCKLLDQPLKWLKPYARPELSRAADQAKWTAMLTITVDEDGRVIDVKPRGGASLSGIELAALKISFILLQTNPPTYQGKRVKSSFALDIEFGQ